MDPHNTKAVHGIAAIVTTLHRRFNSTQVKVNPCDDQGLYRFSGRTIVSVDGTLTDCITQTGREPVECTSDHLNLSESEWLTTASMTLPGYVVTLPDGTTDTITAVRGAGSDFDLAGQVLWTLFHDTHGTEHYPDGCGDMTPTRYMDGVSGAGTNDTLTIWNEKARAGAGMQLVDGVIFFQSGRVVFVSIKAHWTNRTGISKGEIVHGINRGSTRVTQCGDETARALGRGDIEVIQLNVHVDANTGHVTQQACLMGKALAQQGVYATNTEAPGKGIYFRAPSKAGKAGRTAMKYRAGACDKASRSIAGTHEVLMDEPGAGWDSLMGHALITLRTDVPANYGVKDNDANRRSGKFVG